MFHHPMMEEDGSHKRGRKLGSGQGKSSLQVALGDEKNVLVAICILDRFKIIRDHKLELVYWRISYRCCVYSAPA